MIKNYLSAIFIASISSVFAQSTIVSTFPENVEVRTTDDQQDNSVLYNQPRLIKDNGNISYDGLASNILANGSFIMVADDFILSEDAIVNKFNFIGFQLAITLRETLRGVQLYIFEDDNGKPAGRPGTDDPYVYKLDLDQPSSAYTLEELSDVSYSGLYYKVSVDAVAANGEGVRLQGGKKYWLAFATKITAESHNMEAARWNWAVGTITGSRTHLIDPQNAFGINATDRWVSFYEVVHYSDYDGATFSLEGVEASDLGTKELYTNQKDLSAVQNNDMLHLLSKNSEIKSVEIYAADGRKVLVSDKLLVNISSLQKGIYIVKAVAKKGNILSTKFIKK